MPGRDWVHHVAIVGAIALGLALFLIAADLAGRGYLNLQQQQANPGARSECIAKLRALGYFVSGEKAQTEKSDGQQPNYDDLCQQIRMAEAAEGATRYAGAQVFLGALSVSLLGLATWFAGRAARYARLAAAAGRESVMEAQRGADAAEITNKIVARGAALELRAYLSVLPAGVNQLIGSSQVMGHVAVRNVGKLPARDVWVEVRMRIGDRDDRQSISLKVDADYQVSTDPKQIEAPPFLVDRAIQPGTEMRQGCREEDVLHIIDVLNHPNQHIYVWGVVYYDDGTKRRFTRFRHRYAIASHARRHDVTHVSPEARVFVDVDKARFHPIGNSAN